MNGFSKKKIGTLTLGEKLKKLRSERRISLSEVSKNTHIQAKYLEYIEEGDYDSLPADVYVRGFLKSYADYLGVDESILLKLFEKERGININIKKKNEKPKANFGPVDIRFFSVTPQRIALLVGILSVVFVGFLLYKEVGSFTNKPKLVVFNLDSGLETEKVDFLIEGVTEKDAKVFINQQAILVQDNGEFSENISLQPGVNHIEIVAINRFEKESRNVYTIFYKRYEPVLDNVPEEEKIFIEIKTEKNPIKITLEADRELVFNGNIIPGTVEKFEAQNEFKISSGKASETLINFNGEEFNPLSENEGFEKDIIFNRDNLKE